MVGVVHAMQPDGIATTFTHQITHGRDRQLTQPATSKRPINDQRMHPPARCRFELITVVSNRLERHKNATGQLAINTKHKRLARRLAFGKRSFIQTQEPLPYTLGR